ncbi:MAG: hypothetical protein GY820_14455 [Gammaproteobacteria bacterium]|nr:hypothetical protein [Gammaproteobacteria bacterium]
MGGPCICTQYVQAAGYVSPHPVRRFAASSSPRGTVRRRDSSPQTTLRNHGLRVAKKRPFGYAEFLMPKSKSAEAKAKRPQHLKFFPG